MRLTDLDSRKDRKLYITLVNKLSFSAALGQITFLNARKQAHILHLTILR